MKTEQITCRMCGGPDGELLSEGSLKIAAPCDKCDEKISQKDEIRKKLEKNNRREAWWRRVVPPEYREIDLTHRGLNQTFLEAAKLYDPVLPPRSGLGFIGETGLGKSRLLFYALRKCHDAKDGVYYMNFVDFTKAAADALNCSSLAEDRRKREAAIESMSLMKRKPTVFLDDIGKGRPTESACEALEALVEYRTSRKLPILWSSNGGGEWLIKRLGPDRGPPVVRKLGGFCTIIKAGEGE